MKAFVTPQVEVIEDLCEGVYADSGSVHTPPETSRDNGVTCTTEGWSHNGGTGSYCQCHIIYKGKDIGHSKITTWWTTNFKINSLKLNSTSGNGTLTLTSDQSFTLTVIDCWNGCHNSCNGIYITGDTIYGNTAIGVSGAHNTNEYTNSIVCYNSKIENVPFF